MKQKDAKNQAREQERLYGWELGEQVQVWGEREARAGAAAARKQAGTAREP
jgi:hypothetical protein